MDTEIRNKNTGLFWYAEVIKNNHTYYLVLVGDDGEIPLFTSNKRILFLEEEMLKIIKAYCKKKYDQISFDRWPSVVIDDKLIRKTILAEDTDRSGMLLNFINLFYDCAKIIGHNTDRSNNALIYSFADHLTFSKEFKNEFLLKNNIERSTLLIEINHLFDLVWQSRVIIKNDAKPSKKLNCLFRFIFLYEKANKC